MRDPDVNLGLAVLVVLAFIGGAWYFRDAFLPQPEPPAAAPAEPAAPEAAVAEGPKYPVTPVERSEPPQRDLVPLPPLADSDRYFLAALVDIFGATIETFLVQEALIDKIVATIDNLPREHVAEKIRPAGRLSESFSVDQAGGDGPIYLSPDNYRRYDPLLTKLASADINAVVDTYRRFYPLFQKSYERLGYPNSYFNDRVVEVIDHLLVVPPRPDEPIRLVRPHVLYKFADPRLEALSSGQKLLLRMGPEHAATVRRFLQELRSELAPL
ncbi:MAG: DUF3014 domain-containing protein [Gammaproteobacteria bacterium]|nr:DUF3014 domain-containing protein [Gammaproteobacteria bacterium]MDH3480172.1 DUF3014 domain-containing protein [Gammaproteobacteria bacterium]